MKIIISINRNLYKKIGEILLRGSKFRIFGFLRVFKSNFTKLYLFFPKHKKDFVKDADVNKYFTLEFIF